MNKTSKIAVASSVTPLDVTDDMVTEELAIPIGVAILGESNSKGKFSKSIPTKQAEVNGKELGIVGVTSKKGSSIASHLAMDTGTKITLFHSGINIIAKKPKLASKLALTISLAEIQVKSAMDTLGVSMSNATGAVIEAILTSITLAKANKANFSFYDDVLITDIDVLVLAAKDDDINMIRVCSNLDDVLSPCGHLDEFTVNAKSLVHPDLTELDTSILTATNVTDEDIIEYMGYLKECPPKELILFGKDSQIHLHIPTIRQTVDMYNYIDSVVETEVNTQLGNMSSTLHKTVMSQLYSSNRMMELAHFISGVTVDGTDFTKTKDIVEAIENMSKEDIETTSDYIVQFVKSNTHATVGLPVYECDSCNKTSPDNEVINPFKEVTSINMVKVFLELTNLNLAELAKE